MAAMTMVKKIRSGKVLGILIVSPFLLCVNFCRKKAAPRNFHLAGRRRLPFIGAILAQIHLTHNTLWTFSPVLRKILHKRPGTSGQLLCASPRRNTARNSPRAIGPAASSCNGSVLFPARVKHFSGPPGKVWQIWRRDFPQGACKVGQPAQNAFGGGFSVSFSQFFSRIA